MISGNGKEPRKEDYQVQRLRLMVAAYHALRSYQKGNRCVELAERVANEIEKHILDAGGLGGILSIAPTDKGR